MINIRQDNALNAFADDLATRAAASDIPYQDYIESLRRFFHADTATRVRLMKTNNEAFLRMKLDEGKVINVIALGERHDRDFADALFARIETMVDELL